MTHRSPGKRAKSASVECGRVGGSTSAIVWREICGNIVLSYTAMAKVQCPAATDLESWSNAAWNDGVQVEQLDPVDTLIVHTRNSRYEIIVVEPHSAQVLVRGGRFLPVYTPATLAGASLGGSFLKVHGVYIGFRMELHVDDGETLVTTPVESIGRDETAAAVC